VVRDWLVKLVAEEPAPSEIEARLLTQPTLAGDVEQIAEQPQLEKHHRIHRGLTGTAVVATDKAANEAEIDGGSEPSHKVICWNGGVERKAQVELRLDRFLAHHGQPLRLGRGRQQEGSPYFLRLDRVRQQPPIGSSMRVDGR